MESKFDFIEVDASLVLAKFPNIVSNLNCEIEKWTHSKEFDMYIAHHLARTINHRERDYDYSFIIYERHFNLSLYYVYEHEKWRITWGNSDDLTESDINRINEILLNAIVPMESVLYVKNNQRKISQKIEGIRLSDFIKAGLL